MHFCFCTLRKDRRKTRLFFFFNVYAVVAFLLQRSTDIANRSKWLNIETSTTVRNTSCRTDFASATPLLSFCGDRFFGSDFSLEYFSGVMILTKLTVNFVSLCIVYVLQAGSKNLWSLSHGNWSNFSKCSFSGFHSKHKIGVWRIWYESLILGCNVFIWVVFKEFGQLNYWLTAWLTSI